MADIVELSLEDVDRKDTAAIRIGPCPDAAYPVVVIIYDVKHGIILEPRASIKLSRDRVKAVIADLQDILDETEVRQ